MSGLKVVGFRAENVLRLKTVEITPDGTLQVIGGRNAQGKSSVLNALWLALGGGAASREFARPIRDGEDHAAVFVDLGSLIVTRTWTKTGTKLTVTSADGATYGSPQRMLDELVGRLSFDPLEFTRLPPSQQRDALLDQVDLDIDIEELDRRRRTLYERRADIGRQGKAIGDVVVDDSLPGSETSASDLLSRIRAAEDHNRAIRAAAEAVPRAASELATRQQEVAELGRRLEAARESVAAAERDYDSAVLASSEIGQPIDVTVLGEQLTSLEDTNARVRDNNHARARAAEKQALVEQYKALTSEIDALDKSKVDALADAAMPVAGLGFDTDGVTFNGLPFSQASRAEQIRVSLAMAMALNPKLRVLRVADGSLLDDDTMAAIREQVADGGYQLWLERVGSGDEGAVIITDGEVQA